MMKNRLSSSLVLIAPFLPASAFAQFQIDWYTIDGGGGSSSGGNFSLTGTIGQHDAVAGTGGPFQCGGGFWGPCPEFHSATPTATPQPCRRFSMSTTFPASSTSTPQRPLRQLRCLNVSPDPERQRLLLLPEQVRGWLPMTRADGAAPGIGRCRKSAP
jgi:hypothetical protein